MIDVTVLPAVLCVLRKMTPSDLVYGTSSIRIPIDSEILLMAICVIVKASQWRYDQYTRPDPVQRRNIQTHHLTQPFLPVCFILLIDRQESQLEK